VRIRSAKCTIGSAAGCTLRLHSPHVPRLACWIVRGKDKLAVRRFEGCPTLNGARFDLAELRPGDRLLVGNIELELLASDALERSSPFGSATANGQVGQTGDSADTTGGRDSIRQIEARLEEALQKVSQLEQESRQGFQASILAAERAEQMHEALAAAHRQWEETAAELTQTRAELSQTQSRLARTEAEYARARAELAQSQRELAHARRELERMRSEVPQPNATQGVDEQRASQHAELEARQAELERKAAQLEQCRAELSARQADLDARQADLVARQAKLDARQAALDVQQQDLEARLAARSAQTDAQAKHEAELRRKEAGLQRKEAELQQKEADLAARAQQLAAQSESWTQRARELEQQQAELASWAAELQTQANAVAAEQTKLQQRAEELDRQAAQMATRSQELDERAAELEAHLQEVQQRLAGLERMQAQLDARTALARSCEQAPATAGSSSASATLVMTAGALVPQRSEPRDRGSEEAEVCSPLPPPARVSGDDEAPGMLPNLPSSDPGNSNADGIETVLSRLVRAGLWREDVTTSPATSRDQLSPASVESVGGGLGSCEVQVPAAAARTDCDHQAQSARFDGHEQRTASAATPASEEEESIEAYMARLLQRVRGESSTAPEPSMAEVAPTPAPAPPPTSAPSQPASKLTPEAYVPRSSAPESQTHLSALREVANVAARVAVGRHTRRQVARAAAGRLLRGLLTAAGGGAAAYWAWQAQSLPGLAGAAIGGLTGLAWMTAAFKQLLGLLRGTRESVSPTATR
jgi:hypothetical protein